MQGKQKPQDISLRSIIVGGINNNIIIILGSCINSTGIIVIIIIIHVLPGAVCRKRARIELTQRRERKKVLWRDEDVSLCGC